MNALTILLWRAIAHYNTSISNIHAMHELNQIHDLYKKFKVLFKVNNNKTNLKGFYEHEKI